MRKNCVRKQIIKIKYGGQDEEAKIFQGSDVLIHMAFTEIALFPIIVIRSNISTEVLG